MASILNHYRTAQRRWRRLDRLVRMMIFNWLGGMALGVTFSVAVLALDISGIRSLLWRSDMPVTGALMLTAAFAFTFGGLVCAAAIMMAGDDDEKPPRSGRKYRRNAEPQLAFVTVGARRSR